MYEYITVQNPKKSNRVIYSTMTVWAKNGEIMQNNFAYRWMQKAELCTFQAKSNIFEMFLHTCTAKPMAISEKFFRNVDF